MSDHSPRRVPPTYVTEKSERRAQLAAQLEASADRLCDYQDRLHAGINSMKPIELERLMDEYRAEQIRYDRIDHELQALEEPKKTKEYIEFRRVYQQNKGNKIKY
ncbi:hypothetical protein [Bacteroides uniformis]|jgi:hypothetical protein|uniref:Uncharacterized protein n=1 Tax=Bacteroides uniformis TaxID=820 RepID=A0A3E4R1G5_BACUN|nr:hypothetical protein [Bacteroides uniformis]RGL13347.1 hypothetical protein DXC80_10340 [Bacteroides uniformis]